MYFRESIKIPLVFVSQISSSPTHIPRLTVIQTEQKSMQWIASFSFGFYCPFLLLLQRYSSFTEAKISINVLYFLPLLHNTTNQPIFVAILLFSISLAQCQLFSTIPEWKRENNNNTTEEGNIICSIFILKASCLSYRLLGMVMWHDS